MGQSRPAVDFLRELVSECGSFYYDRCESGHGSVRELGLRGKLMGSRPPHRNVRNRAPPQLGFVLLYVV